MAGRLRERNSEVHAASSHLPAQLPHIHTLASLQTGKLPSPVLEVFTNYIFTTKVMALSSLSQAVMKPPELNPETEESLPSRRSPEGPDPPVLTEVSPPIDSPLDLESVEKKMDSGRYKSVVRVFKYVLL